MKRLILSIIFLISVSALSGCIQEIKTTEEESDAIAEYMAGLLLKYDNKYDRALIPNKDTEDNFNNNLNKITDKKINASTDSSTINGSSVKSSASLTDIIGQKNFDITYSGYKLTSFYPENYINTYILVEADEGKQLLIIKFNIKNKSKKADKINLGEAGIKYQLSVDGTIIDKPWFTVLENDLQYIDMEIKGEAVTEAVLVYQISNKADTSTMKLSISKDNKEVVIPIK